MTKDLEPTNGKTSLYLGKDFSKKDLKGNRLYNDILKLHINLIEGVNEAYNGYIKKIMHLTGPYKSINTQDLKPLKKPSEIIDPNIARKTLIGAYSDNPIVKGSIEDIKTIEETVEELDEESNKFFGLLGRFGGSEYNKKVKDLDKIVDASYLKTNLKNRLKPNYFASAVGYAFAGSYMISRAAPIVLSALFGGETGDIAADQARAEIISDYVFNFCAYFGGGVAGITAQFFGRDKRKTAYNKKLGRIIDEDINEVF